MKESRAERLPAVAGETMTTVAMAAINLTARRRAASTNTAARRSPRAYRPVHPPLASIVGAPRRRRTASALRFRWTEQGVLEAGPVGLGQRRLVMRREVGEQPAHQGAVPYHSSANSPVDVTDGHHRSRGTAGGFGAVPAVNHNRDGEGIPEAREPMGPILQRA